MKTFLGIGLGPIQTGIFVSGASKGKFDRIVIAEVDDVVRNAIKANNGTISVNIAAKDRIYREDYPGLEVYSPMNPDELPKLIDAAAEAKRFGIHASRSVNYKSDGQGPALNYEVINDAVHSIRSCFSISPDWKARIDEDVKKRGR